VLQSLVVVGQAGAESLPSRGSWFGRSMDLLSVINFNVRMMKPGCAVPRLSFVQLFWASIAGVALAAGLMGLACVARREWRKREEQRSRREGEQEEERRSSSES